MMTNDIILIDIKHNQDDKHVEKLHYEICICNAFKLSLSFTALKHDDDMRKIIDHAGKHNNNKK